MLSLWCLPLVFAAGMVVREILGEQKTPPSQVFDYSAELHIKNLESDLKFERSKNQRLQDENDSLKKERESLRGIVVDGVVLAVKR